VVLWHDSQSANEECWEVSHPDFRLDRYYYMGRVPSFRFEVSMFEVSMDPRNRGMGSLSLSLHLNSVLRSFKPFRTHNLFFADISYIKVCLGSGRRAYTLLLSKVRHEYPVYIYMFILGGHGGNLVRARTWRRTIKDATTPLLLLLFDEVYRLSSVHCWGAFNRQSERGVRTTAESQPRRDLNCNGYFEGALGQQTYD
jgi:hypothetical protein